MAEPEPAADLEDGSEEFFVRLLTEDVKINKQRDTEKVRKYAKRLASEDISKADFDQISPEDLKNDFGFSRGHINRIKEYREGGEGGGSSKQLIVAAAKVEDGDRADDNAMPEGAEAGELERTDTFTSNFSALVATWNEEDDAMPSPKVEAERQNQVAEMKAKLRSTIGTRRTLRVLSARCTRSRARGGASCWGRRVL